MIRVKKSYRLWALSLLFAVMALAYFLYQYGENLAGTILRELIEERTGRAYEVSFDDIDFSVVSKSLTAIHFRLTPNPRNEHDSTLNLYELHIPEASITLKSILSIYLDRELIFRDITVKNPHVSMFKYKRGVKTATFSFEAGNLYQLISQYLYTFSIDSLKLQDAALHYHNTSGPQAVNFLLDQIHFNIKDLLIDSASSAEEKFLFTDAITLVITDQFFRLPDSLHHLSFDEFALNTKSRNILFKNLVLGHRKRPPGEVATTQSLYTASIPQLNFRGIDFLRAYNENALYLDSVRLLQPEITIDQQKIESEKHANSLPAAFFKLFGKLSIRRIYLDEGRLAVTNHDEHNIRSLHVQKVNMRLDHFYVDSASFVFDRQNEYLTDMRLDADDFSMVLRDSLHRATFKRFSLVTDQGLLEIDSLEIAPLEQVQAPVSVKSAIQKLVVEGFDKDRWLKQNELHAKRLRVDAAHIALNSTQTPSVHATGPGMPLRSIMISDIDLRNMDLAYTDPKNHLNGQNVDLHFQNFLLDDSTMQPGKWHEVAHPFRINMDDFSFTRGQERVATGQVSIENSGSSIHLNHIRVETPKNDFPYIIGRLSVSGWEPGQFTRNRVVKFDTLDIWQPDLKINLKKETGAEKAILNRILHHTYFELVQLHRGEVSLYRDGQKVSFATHLDASLSSFHYDSLVHEYFTGVSFEADTFAFLLGGIDHTLTGRHIRVSQEDSTVQIHRMMLKPNAPRDREFDVTARETDFGHLDFHRALNSGRIHFRNGTMRQPQIHLKLADGQEEQPAVASDLLQFDRFHLTDGNLFLTHPGDSVFVSMSSFYLIAEDFDLEPSPERWFFAKKYLYEAAHTKVKIPGLQDTITLDQARIDTYRGDIQATGLSVSKKNVFDVQVPSLSVTGLNLHQLRSNVFQLDTIRLSGLRSRLGLERFRAGDQQHSHTFTVGHIHLDSGRLDLFHSQLNHRDSIRLQHFSVMADGFHFDSTSHTKKFSDVVKAIDLSGDSIRYRLPDGLYSVSIGTYSYNHLEEKVEIRDLELLPTYDQEAFQNQLEYQQDWFDGSIKSLDLEGFDFDTLLHHQLLVIQKVNIRDLILDTHRDKRLPREPEVVKPLPQTAIRSLPLTVIIDTVSVQNGLVSHSEFVEDGEQSGVIFFRNIHATLTNVTNHPATLARAPYMTFRATGLLMHTGNFMLRVAFDMDHPHDRFEMTGQVAEMDLQELNQFMEHTAFVHIRDGHNRQVTFSFNADNDYSVGKMKFYYDDLKIAILNKETYGDKGHGASFKSFFANTFVVNSRNPRFLFIRDGDIFYQRDHSKSIFNYWAKSLLSGVVSSIGAKNNKKDIRKLNDKMKAELDQQTK